MKKSKHSVWLVLFLSILTLQTQAETGTSSSQGELELRDLRTSDNYSLQGVLARLSFGSEDLSSSQIEAESLGLRFISETAELRRLGLSHQLRPASGGLWSLHLGVAEVQTRAQRGQLGLGRLSYQSEEGLRFWRVSLEKNLPARDLGVRSTTALTTTEESLNLSFSKLWAEKWRPSLQLKTARLSDDNTRQGADLALMYGVSTGWPWIWIGYGAALQEHQKVSALYWSPRRFTNHGLRSDASFALVGDWSALLGLNLNHYDEDGFTGQGHYGVAGLQKNWGPAHWIRLSTTQIRSGQSQSRWTSDEVKLQGLFSF